MSDNTEPFIIYDFDPNNIPPEYLRAVGLVVAASAQTEHVLQEFIGALLGVDHIQMLALTTHLSYPQKDDIIRALAELGAPSVSELDKIDDLLDKAKEAMNKRNIIVHNALARHPDTGEVLSHRLKARGRIELEFKPITVSEMERDAADIYEAGINIVKFMMSRGLEARTRTTPLRTAPKRTKKEREKRQGKQ